MSFTTINESMAQKRESHHLGGTDMDIDSDTRSDMVTGHGIHEKNENTDKRKNHAINHAPNYQQFTNNSISQTRRAGKLIREGDFQRSR